ncbi:hypothetical protein TVAG_220290 [Trichomonas vaginalis G3]|uniref:Uncharacterized protein n=1 Tax=Trichomonas vaginalis (strain ATCC PRA-98 / G3) TaxID=412133 RepID=A2FPV0_TRIV3|nr:hypothetical protein TVAGG3_0861480 [Trichomonas vaginalis G3]EAX93054.1 hypothetical protein TVAG_220290 [Trichomonas vaginalis G3]KAI5500707.1 hypothetical protein TVAGG3_0861480 [Trichomonas vaginalis G3]|eukprot:XP_001305984.1 hypothetical protein [Trichomonas vaginalis G3]
MSDEFDLVNSQSLDAAEIVRIPPDVFEHLKHGDYKIVNDSTDRYNIIDDKGTVIVNISRIKSISTESGELESVYKMTDKNEFTQLYSISGSCTVVRSKGTFSIKQKDSPLSRKSKIDDTEEIIPNYQNRFPRSLSEKYQKLQNESTECKKIIQDKISEFQSLITYGINSDNQLTLQRLKAEIEYEQKRLKDLQNQIVDFKHTVDERFEKQQKKDEK